MTSKKLLPDDETYTPDPAPEPNDLEGDGKKKKKGKTYVEDPNDPAYVEPRLRPDWTPDQPG